MQWSSCFGQILSEGEHVHCFRWIPSGPGKKKKKKSITKTTTCQWVLQLSAGAPVSKSNPVLQFFLLLQTLLKRIDTE